MGESMCRILSGTTAEDDRNTHWKHALKVHHTELYHITGGSAPYYFQQKK